MPDTLRVTCRTPGCTNHGAPIVMAATVTDLDGTRDVDQFYCGVCGQQITDVDRGADLVPAEVDLPTPTEDARAEPVEEVEQDG